MWCTKLRWPAVLLACLGLSACMTNPPQSHTIQVRPVVVTPCTTSSSIVYVPARDLSNCGVVPAHWYYSTYIPERRVCDYTYVPGQMQWCSVSGYGCYKHCAYHHRCKSVVCSKHHMSH